MPRPAAWQTSWARCRARLQRLGIDVVVVMPKYRSITPERFPLRRTDWLLQVPVSNQTVTAGVLQSELDDQVPVYLVEADQYFGAVRPVRHAGW